MRGAQPELRHSASDPPSHHLERHWEGVGRGAARRPGSKTAGTPELSASLADDLATVPLMRSDWSERGPTIHRLGSYNRSLAQLNNVFGGGG